MFQPDTDTEEQRPTQGTTNKINHVSLSLNLISEHFIYRYKPLVCFH
jgi:hypothetical protein